MIFLIPARAGSKRLPGKNKRLFCGLPLWMWSLATASRLWSREQDAVILATDDEEIARVAMVPLRPLEISQDDTPTQAVVDWAWALAPTQDALCLLQPTSPTRSDHLVRRLIAHGGQVRSVTDGKPNGQCYVYRRGVTGWIDIETEKGHDIDTLEDFHAAERNMQRRFA